MPSLTVENYCKAIHQLGVTAAVEWVTTGKLAEALAVTPGTVTSMLKTLAEAELAEYRPYEGIRLTRRGRSLALRVVRRHRLIELFLVRTLGLTWDQVHDEAENMEHAVSDALIDRIDDFLGRPEYDPHGDPIPQADGTMRGDAAGGRLLTECAPGERVRVVRVLSQDGDFLRDLSAAGLERGGIAEVTAWQPALGVISLSVNGKPIALARTAAEQVRVESAVASP